MRTCFAGWVRLIALKQLQHADHSVQRCADFVAHAGQKPGLGQIGGLGAGPGGVGRVHLAHHVLGPRHHGLFQMAAQPGPSPALRRRMFSDFSMRPISSCPVMAMGVS